MTAPTVMDALDTLLEAPRLSACCGVRMPGDLCPSCREHSGGERDCVCGEPIPDHRAPLLAHSASCAALRQLAGGGR